MLLTASAGTLQPSLIGEARRTLDLALAHLLDTRHRGGYWEAPADPRILDTAVVAHAISGGPRDRAATEAYDRARNWLLAAAPQCHDPVAHEIDCWLRDLTTNRPDEPPPVPDISSGKYGGRALLVQTLGVSADAPGADVAGLLEMVGAATRVSQGQRLKQWQRVNLIAAELIARAKLDLPVPRRLLAALEAEQHPEGSFCGMPAVTGIAYRALRLTQGDPLAAQRCLRCILETQRADGTWGFVSNDVWDTSLTVRSFMGIPLFDRRALQPALDFVERAQNPDGGWSFRRGLESDSDSTGAALLALAGTPQGQHAWPAARAFARRTQLPSGPWTSWQSADDTPAVDGTAQMVAGVSAYGYLVEDICRAGAWLASQYQGDSPWKADWYSPWGYAVNEVARAIGWSHPRSLDGVRFLVEHQCADGGWPTVGGDTSPAPAATGLALSAIAHSGVIVPAETITGAVTFIIDSQRDDGSWAGAPVMYGPRPFLVHFPTHTHAFVGAGLRDLVQHL